MPYDRSRRLAALLLSAALHALVLALAGEGKLDSGDEAYRSRAEARVTYLMVVPAPPGKGTSKPEQAPRSADRASFPFIERPSERGVVHIASRAPASMAAPPAPTAEQWAFAARYTLKNSKGYRYTWGQQVRSMMGTAIEGPDQGVVRFRVEFAPDGSLARLETLWTTSPVAEQLARKAIARMPPLPPTPTGKPLVFDRTITFSPFASDAPPIYRDDCLPDAPGFSNPFVWDGQSPQVRGTPRPTEPPDPQALEDCLKQLPPDSIEAEYANDQQVIDRWGARRLDR